ncbi:MAG: hypothetical protein ACT6Q8_24200 [Niveispirillum sp.]|uniref:hypothetical protein n=1 Tax=Niveispirillum sp. TaxID=1917217 RepID=UPI004036A585
MPPKFSRPDITRDVAAALVAEHGNIGRAAAAAGMDRVTFGRRLRQTAPEVPPEKPAPIQLDASPASRKIVALEDEVSRLRRELRAAHRHGLTEDRVLEVIGAAGAAELPVPTWTRQAPTAVKTSGIPVAMWSDWHLGETVDRKQMDGYNAFDLSIGRQRLRNLVTRTIDFCYEHIASPAYDGIVVCLGGDMVSGDIHEELALSNELTLMETVLTLSGEITAALREIQKAFGRVHVVCVTGNHGRTTHKTYAKKRNATNADWLAYQIAKRELSSVTEITWQIAESNDALFSVYSKKYMLTHGDSLGVKGGDGIIGAAGPIIRGCKRLKAAYAASGCHIDHVLLGHFHQYMTLPGITVNDCLKGYDEWARSMRFEPHPPGQALHLDHPRWGTTIQTQIFVDAPHGGTVHAGAHQPSWLAA